SDVCSSDLESEAFYKKIKNRIDYIDGANLIANDAIEQVILTGEARAYGLELLMRKNQGRLQGWLAYTLSKSEQKTPGRTAGVNVLNFAEWYNTPYDKTHDFSLYANYELNKKWNVNANSVLQTSQPTNYPIGRFEFQNLSVPSYGQRNKVRLTAYHRIAVSATLAPRATQ